MRKIISGSIKKIPVLLPNTDCKKIITAALWNKGVRRRGKDFSVQKKSNIFMCRVSADVENIQK